MVSLADSLPAVVPVVASTTPHAPFVRRYHELLTHALDAEAWRQVEVLARTLQRAWHEGRHLFLCGNGGSASNAAHLANDYVLGLTPDKRRGLRATALSANTSLVTCVANDVSYEQCFAHQLYTLASPGDVLVALSGSGNSPNILAALRSARELGLETFAILGYDGGKARTLAAHPIHFAVHDMQVAEDLQMMVGHMAMQFLRDEAAAA